MSQPSFEAPTFCSTYRSGPIKKGTSIGCQNRNGTTRKLFKSRRIFDTDFKLPVVSSIKTQGLSINQVRRDMELGESAARRWLGQFEAEQSGQNGIGKPLNAEHNALDSSSLKTGKLKAMLN